jgi:hypothetical protein
MCDEKNTIETLQYELKKGGIFFIFVFFLLSKASDESVGRDFFWAETLLSPP